MRVSDDGNNIVKDDLEVEIKKWSKMPAAAACFPIYAYWVRENRAAARDKETQNEQSKC
jgi:hypothetical protein